MEVVVAEPRTYVERTTRRFDVVDLALTSPYRPVTSGAYSLAEVFYTPVAARIVGYGLPVSEASLAYCHALLRDPAVRAWRAEGAKITYDPDPYALPLDSAPWPF